MEQMDGPEGLHPSVYSLFQCSPAEAIAGTVYCTHSLESVQLHKCDSGHTSVNHKDILHRLVIPSIEDKIGLNEIRFPR